MATGLMLEREPELAELDGLVKGVRNGRGATIVVQGQPGLGKSTLLAEARQEASHTAGLTLLSFCCGELERELAWAAALGLLTPVIDVLSPRARDRLFEGRARAAAKLFLDAADPGPDPPDPTGQGAMVALFELMAALARDQPVLVVLDDAHWADRQSLQLLAYAQRRIGRLPLGLVIGTRPAWESAEPELLERVTMGPDTRVQTLSALGLRSVAELVRWQGFPSASPRFCQAVWQVTTGNPFYVNELLHELRDDEIDPDAGAEELMRIPPASVRRSVLVRLGRLRAPQAAELAQATAVLGDVSSLRNAADLAGIRSDQASRALDALTSAELMAAGEPLRFVHPLVRAAVYADIPAGRRAGLHARAAELLAADHASPELVGTHLVQAPLAASVQTVAGLHAAAARARARGAPASAARFLRRALQEPPGPEARQQLLVGLASAETALGDTAAIAHLSEALELAGDDRRRASILLWLGWAEHNAGRFDRAARAFERGLELLPEGLRGEDGVAANLEAGYLTSARFDSSRVPDALARIKVIEAAPERGLGAGRDLLAQVLFLRTMSGAPRAEILELAERLWDGGQLLAQRGPDSQALWHVIGAFIWADAHAPAVHAIELTLSVADERGLVLTTARARFARAWPNYWMGRIPQAAADAQAAVEVWSGGLETYLPAALYWLGLSELERDDPEAARRALTLAGPPERWRGTAMMPFMLGLQGHVEASAGRTDEALACHLACGEACVALQVINPAVMPWRSDAAQVLRLGGQTQQARRLAGEELKLARAGGIPRAIGVALRTLGLCSPGEPRVRLLEESVRALEASGATLEHARSLVELGSAIRRQGRRRDARAPLELALSLVHGLGATALVRRAETELRAAGGRARRPSHAGQDALTASERRVAELAAIGHSNRHIAGLLQISVKAVEWHLHQSYRKLEIGSRTQLPDALLS